MINFDQCRVIVNNSGLFAENATISSTNSLTPAYVLGSRGPINVVPNGALTTNFNIGYIVKVDQDPNYSIVNNIKNITNIMHSGVNIIVGGVTGYNAYLQTYSLRAEPNQLLRASASFVSYKNLSGQFTTLQTGTIDNVSGRLNIGWTTHILSGASYLHSPVYGLNYDFQANWQPIFKVGQSEPIQVEYLGASEQVSFLRDKYHHINLTGEMAVGASPNALIHGFTNDSNIDFLRYDFLCNSSNNTPFLVLSLSGMRIMSSDTTVQLDDIVLTESTVIKYY